MGTPDFSVPTLQELILDKNHQIAAVFTQRPKPKGRGYIETISPVHEVAISHNIPVYTPKTLRDPEIHSLVNSIEADIIVVVAYGFIIPKEILKSKKYGCLNIHPSRLPRFRGAAPLQRTIISGDQETSVCIMQMEEGLDTGDILLKKDINLNDRITFQELHDLCAETGAKLLIETLKSIDSIIPTKQSNEGITYAHKLSKEESKIDFSKTAFEIDCMVRGMNPWPGVYFEYNKENIKILESSYENIKHDYPCGYVVDDNLKIACSHGFITLKKLQRPGKKAITSKEFLMAVKIYSGSSLLS